MGLHTQSSTMSLLPSILITKQRCYDEEGRGVGGGRRDGESPVGRRHRGPRARSAVCVLSHRRQIYPPAPLLPVYVWSLTLCPKHTPRDSLP